MCLEVGERRSSDVAALARRQLELGGARHQRLGANRRRGHGGPAAPAVLWDAAGVHSLGLDGAGYAINNQGHVVGRHWSSQGWFGFLLQNGAFTDLNTLLAPGSGWIIDTAYDINERGQIVGPARSTGTRVPFC